MYIHCITWIHYLCLFKTICSVSFSKCSLHQSTNIDWPWQHGRAQQHQWSQWTVRMLISMIRWTATSYLLQDTCFKYNYIYTHVHPNIARERERYIYIYTYSFSKLTYNRGIPTPVSPQKLLIHSRKLWLHKPCLWVPSLSLLCKGFKSACLRFISQTIR